MTSDIASFFAGLPLFASLSADELKEMTWTARPFELAAGETLCVQGDHAEEMFAIREGSLQLSIEIAGSGETPIATLPPGSILGETALVSLGQRTATARALEPTSGYALHRKAFEVLHAAYRPSAAKVLRELCALISDRIASTNPGNPETAHGGRPPDLSPFRHPATDLDFENLRRLPVLADFHPEEIDSLLAEFRKLLVPKGTVLFREGDASGSSFITVRGAVELCIDHEGWRDKLALQGPGTMFGEAGLFSKRDRSATGWARENSILLEIDRPTFDRLFESHSIVAFKFFDAAVKGLIDLMRRAVARQAWFETERRGFLS